MVNLIDNLIMLKNCDNDYVIARAKPKIAMKVEEENVESSFITVEFFQ